MSHLALPFLRSSILRTARPAPAPARLQALPARAGLTTRKENPPLPSRIPSEADFVKHAAARKLEQGNPKEYFRCASMFLTAQKNRAPKGSDRLKSPFLLRRIGLPLQTFHEAAIFLNGLGSGSLHGTPGRQPMTPVMLAMLQYASAQGHDASTLTYTYVQLMLNDIREWNPEFSKDLRARLDAIVSTNLSPDALYVVARLAAYDGDEKLAATLADRAFKLKSVDPWVPFVWEAGAYVLRGQICRRAGDSVGARRYFYSAASRFLSQPANYELLYDGECPEDVKGLVQNAHGGGRLDMLRVSEAESDFAARMLERGDKQRFMDHQYMAQEWMRLAQTKDEDLRNERG